MSAVDQGLDAAVQRVMRVAGCQLISERRGGIGYCAIHRSGWLSDGCATAEEAARAAREDVPALTQQARADELEQASNATGEMGAHILDCRFPDTRCDCGCITGRMQAHYWLRDRAAAIREGREP